MRGESNLFQSPIACGFRIDIGAPLPAQPKVSNMLSFAKKMPRLKIMEKIRNPSKRKPGLHASTGPFMPPGHFPAGLMLSSGGLASRLAGCAASAGAGAALCPLPPSTWGGDLSFQDSELPLSALASLGFPSAMGCRSSGPKKYFYRPSQYHLLKILLSLCLIASSIG